MSHCSVDCLLNLYLARKLITEICGIMRKLQIIGYESEVNLTSVFQLSTITGLVNLISCLLAVAFYYSIIVA